VLGVDVEAAEEDVNAVVAADPSPLVTGRPVTGLLHPV
jgi:hypothetical protein